MKTLLEKLVTANRWRVRTGKLGSDDALGWNGAFIVPINGELWQVVIGDGMGWRHLSATNAQRRQLPPWEVMTRLKDLFFADEDCVVLYIPPKAEYVNDHPWVHHLFQSLEEDFPRPPVALV